MGIDLQSPSMLANSIPLCYHEEHDGLFACVTFKAQMNNVGSMMAYYKVNNVGSMVAYYKEQSVDT